MKGNLGCEIVLVEPGRISYPLSDPAPNSQTLDRYYCH